MIDWTDDSGVARRIVFDAIVREDHLSSAAATMHPVEPGAVMSDHVIQNQEQLRFDVVVSNTPIRPPTTQARGVSGGVGRVELGNVSRLRRTRGAHGSEPSEIESVAEVLDAQVLTFDGQFDRVADVRRELRELMRSGLTCRVTTEIEVYEDCVLEEISLPREATTAGGPTFSLAFRQIRYATSREVLAPEPLQPRGARQRNRGAQSAEEPTDAEGERASLAYQALRLTGGFK